MRERGGGESNNVFNDVDIIYRKDRSILRYSSLREIVNNKKKDKITV